MGDGWNKQYAPKTEEFAKGSEIEKYKDGKLLPSGSNIVADKILYPHMHQPKSKAGKGISNECLGEALKKMIRQYQNGRPVRKMVPAPSATRKEYS